MVAGLYESFGFEKISQDEEGNTAWRLLVEGYEDKKYCYKGEGGALCLARTR